MQPGKCILLKNGKSKEHLYIVLSCPNISDNKFVFLNLTTKKNQDGEDHTVVLCAGEHPFIKHETYVLYSDARLIEVDKFRQLIRNSSFDYYPHDVSENMLNKIRVGLQESPFAPEYIGIHFNETVSNCTIDPCSCMLK